MHTRMLVTINKDSLETREAAKQAVVNYLEAEGFCGRGRFGHGYADWFVVGGRWSGELTRAHLDPQKVVDVEQALQEAGEKWMQEAGSYDEFCQKMELEILPRFLSEAEVPLDLRPLWSRDTFLLLEGYADDAMVVDQAIYDRLLAEYQGISENEFVLDINYEAMSPAMIGRKWVIIIDYYT